MKILVLTAGLPYPPDLDGARRKLFHLLYELAGEHDFTVVCLETPEQQAPSADVEAFRERVPATIHRITVNSPDCRKAKGPLLSGFCRYWSQAAGRDLDEVCRVTNPDVVHVDRALCAWYIPHIEHPAVVLAPNDSVSLQEKRRRAALPRFGRAWLLAWNDYRRAIAYERRFYSQADECVFVSSADADYFTEISPGSRATAIPSGVDTDYFHHPDQGVRDASTLLLTGTMDFPPNAEAAQRLAQEIWPAVKRQAPAARLVLAGRNPGPEIRSLHNPAAGVEVTGAVPDLRPYLARATLFVAPLISGGGIKNKVLEAMAMGCPVIASELGIAGIPEATETCRICSSNDEFVSAVLELLGDVAARERMSEAGLELVRSRYTWQSCAATHVAVYQRLAAQAQPRRHDLPVHAP